MCKPSGRRENSLRFCLVVALCASIVPESRHRGARGMATVMRARSRTSWGYGKVSTRSTDPRCGMSLTDVNGDGILELTQAESFYSFCHSMGPEFSLGRGVEVGIATVGSRKDVLEVDIRLICIEDNNVHA